MYVRTCVQGVGLFVTALTYIQVLNSRRVFPFR